MSGGGYHRQQHGGRGLTFDVTRRGGGRVSAIAAAAAAVSPHLTRIRNTQTDRSIRRYFINHNKKRIKYLRICLSVYCGFASDAAAAAATRPAPRSPGLIDVRESVITVSDRRPSWPTEPLHRVVVSPCTVQWNATVVALAIVRFRRP